MYIKSIITASAATLLFTVFAHADTTHDLKRHDPANVTLAANETKNHGSGHTMAMKPVKVGDLEISSAIARATPPNAPVSAGYMVIKNNGSKSDRLIGGTASFAGKVEVHEMKMDGDIMKMRKLAGGLEIPAGGQVTLKPGGLHLMFMKLTEQLKEGESRKVTLEFERAGKIELMLPVKKVEGMGSHHKKKSS